MTNAIDIHTHIVPRDLPAYTGRAGAAAWPSLRPAGCGHMDYTAIASALKEISYDKYASAEAFPWPDSNSAARATIDAFNQYLA